MTTTQKLQPRQGKRLGRPMPYETMENTHEETERNEEETERFLETMGQLLKGSKTIAMLEALAQGQPDMRDLY